MGAKAVFPVAKQRCPPVESRDVLGLEGGKMILLSFPLEGGFFSFSFLFFKEKSQFKVHIELHWKM